MSRRLMPFIVAAATGVISGIYIFQPMLSPAGASKAKTPAEQGQPEIQTNINEPVSSAREALFQPARPLVNSEKPRKQ